MLHAAYQVRARDLHGYPERAIPWTAAPPLTFGGGSSRSVPDPRTVTHLHCISSRNAARLRPWSVLTYLTPDMIFIETKDRDPGIQDHGKQCHLDPVCIDDILLVDCLIAGNL